MALLVSTMNEKVNASVISFKTVKEIWDTLKDMYSNEQNISRIA